MRKKSLYFFVLTFLSVFAISLYASAEENERKEALRQLFSRADSGDGKALYDVAVLYERGYDSIPVDSLLSIEFYKKSAKAGYAPAQNYIGYLYFNGERINQDVDSALYWMAKAAGGGDVKAANNLGYLLAESDVVTRDYPQALMWLTKAADAGLPVASLNLADLYRKGLGTEADTLKATELYEKAIQGGIPDAELKLLGMMGHQWTNLPADSALTLGIKYYTTGAPVIGVTLFETAAKDNDAIAFAFLGDAYSRGIGVEYDHDKSVEYFIRAAAAGEPASEFVIGELLEIFPDTFTIPAILDVISDIYGPEPPEEIYDANYWLDSAASKGIENAEKAYDVLFSY